MKKIALVGGLGPEGTLDYYRGIIAGFRSDYEAVGYPEMVIESLNLKVLLSLANDGNWDEISRIIATKFEASRLAGADFGAIAANTPHKVFESIQAATSLPLISIVTATRKAVQEHGFSKLGLLGTEFTMQSDFYFEEFAKVDIELVVPELGEQKYIHEKLFSEIEHGVVKPETKQGFVDVVDRMARDNGIQGLISACTEFPLVIQPADFSIDFFDTLAIHVASIVEYAKT